MLHNGKVELVLEELELYSGGEISPSRKTYITNVASFLKRNLGYASLPRRSASLWLVSVNR